MIIKNFLSITGLTDPITTNPEVYDLYWSLYTVYSTKESVGFSLVWSMRSLEIVEN